MVEYNYWFFNWIYVLECLYFMEWIMTFPVIIIFLVLLLWFVICLPLLVFFYLEGKLSKVYDMVILLSLCASMVMTFIVVAIIVLVY